MVTVLRQSLKLATAVGRTVERRHRLWKSNTLQEFFCPSAWTSRGVCCMHCCCCCCCCPANTARPSETCLLTAERSERHRLLQHCPTSKSCSSIARIHYMCWMCCRAFSPEKKNGKRGFNMMVINGMLFISIFFFLGHTTCGLLLQISLSCICVCLYVDHTDVLCTDGWSNQYAIWELTHLGWRNHVSVGRRYVRDQCHLPKW